MRIEFNRVTSLAFIVASSLAAEPRFKIRLGNGLSTTPLDGRLILVVSKNMQDEPRFQVTWGLGTQQIFGVDVEGWKAGETMEMSGSTPGSPLRMLADLRPGKYNVQAVLN